MIVVVEDSFIRAEGAFSNIGVVKLFEEGSIGMVWEILP